MNAPKLIISRAGRKCTPTKKPDMVQPKATTRGRKTTSVASPTVVSKRRRRSSSKVDEVEAASQEAVPAAIETISNPSPTKRLRLKQPRRSILEVSEREALELDKVETEQNTSHLKPMDEVEFKSSQVEALEQKDYSGLTKAQMEYLLYINEAALRNVGVTTFRGKKKEFYGKILDKHHDAIKESFKNLKLAQGGKTSPIAKKKPLVDYSTFSFGKAQVSSDMEVVLLVTQDSKLHRLGQGRVKRIHPSVVDYPNLLDTASDFTYVEVTQMEAEFEGFQLDHEVEAVQLGEYYAWPLSHIVEEKIFVSKTRDEFESVEEFFDSQPLAVETKMNKPEQQSQRESDKSNIARLKNCDGNMYLEDEVEHLHYTTMVLSDRIKYLMMENSELKLREERGQAIKDEYLRIVETIPAIKYKAVELVKSLMSIDSKEEMVDVEEVHPITINKVNICIGHSDWQTLSKNQPILAMNLFLTLVAPAFDLDFNRYSYCLPRTSHLNSKNKIVLEEEIVRIIAESARKNLSSIRAKCRDVKMVHRYIGKALSQLHQERLGMDEETPCVGEEDDEMNESEDVEE